MKTCILCQLNPPIENSHVVSKFFFRWLKACTPHGTLRHTDDIGKPYQDGWKSDYLCSSCERTFSKWEGTFSAKFFRPWVVKAQTTYQVTEEISLFLASIHFRCLQQALDKNPQKGLAQLKVMHQELRQVCLAKLLPPTGCHFYMEFVPLITDPARGFPVGSNTYLHQSVHGTTFPFYSPHTNEEVTISYVKLPSIITLFSCSDLEKTFGLPGTVGTVVPKTGTMDTSTQGGLLVQLMNDTIAESAATIQQSYSQIPPKQLRKNIQKIQSAPNPGGFRAHEIFLADMALMPPSPDAKETIRQPPTNITNDEIAHLLPLREPQIGMHTDIILSIEKGTGKCGSAGCVHVLFRGLEYVITCHHVLKDEREYFTGPQRLKKDMIDEGMKHEVPPMELVGSDAACDIAVFRLKGIQLQDIPKSVYDLSQSPFIFDNLSKNLGLLSFIYGTPGFAQRYFQYPDLVLYMNTPVYTAHGPITEVLPEKIVGDFAEKELLELNTEVALQLTGVQPTGGARDLHGMSGSGLWVYSGLSDKFELAGILCGRNQHCDPATDHLIDFTPVWKLKEVLERLIPEKP